MITEAELLAEWTARRQRTPEEEALDWFMAELRARWVPGSKPLYVPIGGNSPQTAVLLSACREAGWRVLPHNGTFGTTLILNPPARAAGEETAEGE